MAWQLRLIRKTMTLEMSMDRKISHNSPPAKKTADCIVLRHATPKNSLMFLHSKTHYRKLQ